MNAPRPPLVYRAVRGWTRLYTRGLPPAVGERRRAEIESDLWEHHALATQLGTASSMVMAEVLTRWLLGLPQDLQWHAQQRHQAFKARSQKRSAPRSSLSAPAVSGTWAQRRAQEMWAYAVRRLMLVVPTLLGVTLLVFTVMRLAPGDLAVMICGEGCDAATLAKLRAELGLDRPMHIQYLSWLGGLLTLDFGSSYFYHAPMSQLLARKLPLSAQVAVMGIGIGTTLGVIGGVIAALKQDTWMDYVVRGLAITGISIPTFWLGMLLILVLVRFFQWIPEQGYTPLWQDPARNLAQLIWPALVISIGFLMGTPLRMMRATMLEVLREDYIRTARAKGLQERVVLVRHAMRNALIPVVTLIGLFLPITVGGLVVTEQVFGLPGIGKMMVDAINQRDYPVVQVVVALVGMAVVVANMGVDLVYGWLDPRIRY